MSATNETPLEKVEEETENSEETQEKQKCHDAPIKGEEVEEVAPSFPKFKPIYFPKTPERLKEVRRLRQILNSPTLNFPTLIVSRQEDALPVLSLYMFEEKHQAKDIKGRSFQPLRIIMPEFLGLRPGNEENSWEITNDVRESMDFLEDELDDNTFCPVFCRLGEYTNFDMMEDFTSRFMKTNNKGIFIVEKKDLTNLKESIDFDMDFVGGFGHLKKPYEREGFSKCVIQDIMPMTNDEKKVYFGTSLKKMAKESNMSLEKEDLEKFIDAVNARFSHEEVFSKIFEVFDRAIVLQKERNSFVQSSTASLPLDVLNCSLDIVAPIHNPIAALIDMDKRLKSKIFGQDRAIRQIYESILSVYGDEDRKKPLVIGFFGPSGVGKTAAAKEISWVMNGQAVSCINMSEYADDFKMSILIGSSKGYVDSEEDGLLAKIIKKNPKAVILLDEFEKAHPKIQQMFLGLFEEGNIHDNHAGDLDFSKTTIILTSNAGVKTEKSIGLMNGGERRYSADMDLIRGSFKPELLGRFDAKILFEPLTKDAMSLIVDKFMGEFSPCFKKLGVDVRLSDKARAELIELGKDPTAGARPLLQILQQKVKVPVMLGVFNKTILPGSCVIVDTIKTDSEEGNADFVTKSNLRVVGAVPLEKHHCNTADLQRDFQNG